jgi:RHS repeat-associated protein
MSENTLTCRKRGHPLSATDKIKDDGAGRLTKIINPLGFETLYEYDDNNNLKKKTDANGQITEYEYNDYNELITVNYIGQAPPAPTSISFTYDNVGNTLTWADGTYQGSYTYDELNRVLTVTTAYPLPLTAYTLSYTYDRFGNKESVTYPDSLGSISYEYDFMNRLTKLTAYPLTLTTEYEYDDASRLTKKTLSNGVYTDYAYDDANRLTSLVNKKSDTSVISSFTYTQDNVGNRETMTTSEGTHTYGYDNTYRLLSADHPVQTDETFTYDKVGNRKTSAQHSDWTYDTNNRLTSYNGFTFTYDNAGNTLSKTKGGNTTTYTWDFENRLISLTTYPLTLTAEYTYDPFGKRLSKTVDGITKYYLYDNEDIVAEYDSSGVIIATYIHGQGIDEPISRTDHLLLTTYHYVFDGLGSVSELTDNTGAVVESYKYDSFGKLEIPPVIDNSYTYTSREYDQETEFYFYRHRYYESTIGRFITADPIGFKGGVNFYSYVLNNPLYFIDPSGLRPPIVCNVRFPPGWIRVTVFENSSKGKLLRTYREEDWRYLSTKFDSFVGYEDDAALSCGCIYKLYGNKIMGVFEKNILYEATLDCMDYCNGTTWQETEQRTVPQEYEEQIGYEGIISAGEVTKYKKGLAFGDSCSCDPF